MKVRRLRWLAAFLIVLLLGSIVGMPARALAAWYPTAVADTRGEVFFDVTYDGARFAATGTGRQPGKVGFHPQVRVSGDGDKWSFSPVKGIIMQLGYEGDHLVGVGSDRLSVSAGVSDWTLETDVPWRNEVRCPGGAGCGTSVSLGFGHGRYVVAVNKTTPEGTHLESVIATTVDLRTWSIFRPAGGQLTRVAFGNNSFVVGASGMILTSSDGINWSTHGAVELPWASGPSEQYIAVDFANGQFLARRSNSGTELLRSANGREWSMHSGTDIPTGKIVFGNGRYVGIGRGSETGGRFHSSLDGMHWSVTEVSEFDAEGLSFGAGVFVAAGWGGLRVSTDGITWDKPGGGSGGTVPPGLRVYIDGDGTRWLDGFPAPFIDPGGRILVPLRPLMQSLGVPDSGIKWNPTARTVTVNHAGHSLHVTLDHRIATVDDVSYELDVPAQIVDGRIFLPIRLVAEALGAAVSWDGRAAHIRSNATSEFTEEQFLTAARAAGERVYCTVFAPLGEDRCTGVLGRTLPFSQVTPQVLRALVAAARDFQASLVWSSPATADAQQPQARLARAEFSADALEFLGTGHLLLIIDHPTFQGYTPAYRQQLVQRINTRVQGIVARAEKTGFSRRAIQTLGIDGTEKALETFEGSQLLWDGIAQINEWAEYRRNPCQGRPVRLEPYVAAFLGGFVVGVDLVPTCTPGEQTAAAAGDVVAGAAGWGDLRDLGKEGYHWLMGEDVDDTTVTLAFAGLVMDGAWANPGPDPGDAVNALLSVTKVALKKLVSTLGREGSRPVRLAFAQGLRQAMLATDKVKALTELKDLAAWAGANPRLAAEAVGATLGISGIRLAALGANLDWTKLSGMLREATRGKGNFGIGQATPEEANALGLAWVGGGYKTSSDGIAWVSADGLRQYRPPFWKPNLGRYQANLEWRNQPQGIWENNGHVDVVSL